MAERASALARMTTTTPLTPAAVTLSERPSGTIVQVSAWPDTVQTVGAVISELLGVEVPETGTGLDESDLRVLAVAPGRYLIAAQSPDLVTRFEAALPSSEAAVTDLSHGRMVLRLEGEAEALLAKVAAIDFSDIAFPPGRVAQTMVHHVDVVVHRLGPTSFELWTYRSFAESLVEWLLDAGEETGAALTR